MRVARAQNSDNDIGINILMMILSLIRSVFGRRISPASDRLSAGFRRQGVPLLRPNRPASEDPTAQRRGARAKP